MELNKQLFYPGTGSELITIEEWLIRYARKMYNKRHEKNPEFTKEDGLVMALDELDDGWGIFVDPTRDEYNYMISLI